MILEIADIRITPGRQAEFEPELQRAIASVISKSKGFKGATVRRSIESPERYVLQVQWETLEDHTKGFRESPLFGEWRAIIGPFFVAPPNVEHFQEF